MSIPPERLLVGEELHKVENLQEITFNLTLNRMCILSKSAHLCFSIIDIPAQPSFETYVSGESLFKKEKRGKIFISTGKPKSEGTPVAIQIPQAIVSNLIQATKEFQKIKATKEFQKILK